MSNNLEYPSVPSNVGHPPSKAEREAAELAWKARRDSGQLSFLTESVTPARGWYTIPKAVRFAVWVWAVLTIIWLVAAVVGIIWLVVLGGAVSQM